MNRSHLWAILQRWIDRQPVQPVSDAAIGRALGVTRQTVGNWRLGLRRMPEPHQLRRIASLTEASYREVLEAALADTGYLRREGLDSAAGDMLVPERAGDTNPQLEGRVSDWTHNGKDADVHHLDQLRGPEPPQDVAARDEGRPSAGERARGEQDDASESQD